jgi:hypothetical protein
MKNLKIENVAAEPKVSLLLLLYSTFGHYPEAVPFFAGTKTFCPTPTS